MTISQEIESRINIVELAGRYLQMKKAGTNYKALCPFHSEKTASFVISPTKNLAYCFGCHHGGGPIKFLSEIEKIEYREAMQILAKEAGIELKTDYYKEHNEKTGDIYDMYKIATEFYHTAIFLSENRSKLEYLLNRGISEDTIRRFKLGYSGNPRELFAKLREKNFSEQDIIDSGIFVAPGRDKFYGRIIFPIANFAGNTVAFTGRITDKGEPKYLNSPASEIFNKSAILYGFHLAKTEVAKRNAIIIVEGQMDTVALQQAGIMNTVGISGTALTKEHIHLIKRLTKKIYLWVDKDKAGTDVIFNSLENLLNEDFDVFIVRSVDDTKDPDEFIKSGGNSEAALNPDWVSVSKKTKSGEDFEDTIKHTLTPVQFYINEGSKKYDIANTTGKKAIWEELKKILKRIRDPIEIDTYIREIAKTLDLSTDVLYSELKSFRDKRVTEAKHTKEWFEIAELIAGYIRLYGFFDLFSEKFQYTIADSVAVPSFFVLKNVPENPDSLAENDEIDFDHIKGLELFIEEENTGITSDIIRSKFNDLVNGLNKICFEQEKRELMNSSDKDSPDYFARYHALLEKGKKIGVRVNRG